MSQPSLPLHTSRLTLRVVQSNDKPFFHQLYADWQVTQYQLRAPAPFTEEHAQAFIDTAIEGLQQTHTYTFIIEVQNSAQAIGVITLRIPSRDPSLYWLLHSSVSLLKCSHGIFFNRQFFSVHWDGAEK